MISTDKAIEPVSVLGATKRLRRDVLRRRSMPILRAARPRGDPAMRLIAVRFGNVLASNGSVVPKFKAQIEAGGPVTVTHPDMVRYFMTIREACDLVVTAASHALATERTDVSVYVLNMGQQVKIVELAERMIALSGLEPGRDIEITFTGVRPGERLHEILFAHNEPTVEIGIAGIVAAKPEQPLGRGDAALACDPGARPRAQRPLGDLRRAARRGAGFPRRSRLSHRGNRGFRIGHGPPAGREQLRRFGDERAGQALGHVALADEPECGRQQRARHRDERRPATGAAAQ